MIKLLFNSPYSPNFNPIEGVIGMTKMNIKRERWNALKMGRELNLDECIKESFLKVPHDKVVKFIHKSYDLL